MKTQQWEGPGRRQSRGWKLVTLTRRATSDVESRFDPEALREQVKGTRAAFRRFWRLTPWGRQIRDPQTGCKRSRRDTSFVLAEEISPRGMVHLHVAVFGEFVLQALLQELWSEAIGEPSIVDLRAVRTNGELQDAFQEVLKYATKGEKDPRTQAVHAAAVELAFRNVRRVEVGGALRAVKVTPQDGKSDDIRPADLHDERTAACEACGMVGEWGWNGRVMPEIVRANGGFGLLIQATVVSSVTSSGDSG